MDKLEDIPIAEDAEMSDHESAIIKQYFAPTDLLEPSSKTSGTSKLSWSNIFRISGIGSILFLALANPWINTLFYKIPHVNGNPIVAFCIKFMIFLVCMVLLVR